MDARYKRGDEIYLLEDRSKASRKKYKITEYILGDVPTALTQRFSRNNEQVKASDHNYLIESILGDEQKTVAESEIEGLCKP